VFYLPGTDVVPTGPSKIGGLTRSCRDQDGLLYGGAADMKSDWPPC
jgi:hypothetical protein